MKCSKNSCDSVNIVLLVRWRPARHCPDNGLPTVYCGRHAPEMRRQGLLKACTCSTCPSHHKIWIDKLTELDPYDAARLHYLDSGLIADKEAMLEQVAYNVPEGWDTFGSLLAWPPADQRVPWLKQNAGPVMRMAASAFVLGLLLTVMWLTGVTF